MVFLYLAFMDTRENDEGQVWRLSLMIEPPCMYKCKKNFALTGWEEMKYLNLSQFLVFS